MLDSLPGVLDKRDIAGHKVLVLFACNWDKRKYGLAAIYRALLLTLEKLIEDEETQVHGFVIVVDWSLFSFKQSTWINPKVLKQMIDGLQVTETLDIQGQGWKFLKKIVCFATEKKQNAFNELTIKGCSSFSEFFHLARFPGDYEGLQHRMNMY